GDVSDRVATLPRLHDAEVRVQRREGVVGDLGLRSRQCRDEARLARRGVPDESDIRDDLELEDDVALPAGGAKQGEAGSLALGVGEGRVAEAALATGRNDYAHTRFREIGEDGAVWVFHDRADGNRQLEVGSRRARTVVSHAGLPILGAADRKSTRLNSSHVKI